MKNEHPNIGNLIGLARQAGHVIKASFQLGMKRTVKEDNTPLTDTDTFINQLVIERFERDWPHIKVVGEEGNGKTDESEYMVLCDPVDGTIPFCRGIPISTFVLSLLKNGRPISAVIYDPFLDRMWHAVRGEGTYLSAGEMRGERVSVSSHDNLHRSHVGMCWWNGSPFHLHEVCAKLMEQSVTWSNMNSIAIYGGLMASGEQDATIFPGLHGWETAAMALIVEEAGGIATDIRGDSLVYGPEGECQGHIISNGHFHSELVELVNSCQ